MDHDFISRTQSQKLERHICQYESPASTRSNRNTDDKPQVSGWGTKDDAIGQVVDVRWLIKRIGGFETDPARTFSLWREFLALRLRSISLAQRRPSLQPPGSRRSPLERFEHAAEAFATDDLFQVERRPFFRSVLPGWWQMTAIAVCPVFAVQPRNQTPMIYAAQQRGTGFAHEKGTTTWKEKRAEGRSLPANVSSCAEGLLSCICVHAHERRFSALLCKSEPFDVWLPLSEPGWVKICERRRHDTTLEVFYPWHPWFGEQVVVHHVMDRRDRAVFRCRLLSDLATKPREVPQWMFDQAASCVMHAREQPRVSVTGLQRLVQLLRRVLKDQHFPLADLGRCDRSCKSLSSEKGFHRFFCIRVALRVLASFRVPADCKW